MLISSTTTTEPEFGETDLAWLVALAELEDETGPHGHPMHEATSAEADPANVAGPYRYVAGMPTRGPSGEIVRAPVVDYAEKARLDALDLYRKQDIDPMNGIIMPVFKVPRKLRKRRRPGTTQQQ